MLVVVVGTVDAGCWCCCLLLSLLLLLLLSFVEPATVLTVYVSYSIMKSLKDQVLPSSAPRLYGVGCNQVGFR